MRLFKYALPILFIAGVALFATRAWTEADDASQHKLAVEHARSEFIQHQAVVRGASDAKYGDEQHQLLRSWFAEQTEIGNRWPTHRNDAPPFIPPAPKAKGGDLDEFKELANSTIGGWREGKFDLFQTVFAGGLRFDVLRVARPAGQQKLVVDLAIWGGPEELEQQETKDGEHVVQHASVPLQFKGLTIKFYDDKNKEVAGMPIEGEPILRLDMPERMVNDAPPGVVLARYEPALFPRDAATVEWTINAAVRTSTNEMRPVSAVFKTKLDPAWSIAAGETWGGKELTATAR